VSRQVVQEALETLARRGYVVELGREGGAWRLRWRDRSGCWETDSWHLEAVGDNALAWVDALDEESGAEDRYARRVA
jgi:DNA-binding FadR family transcriptional regulator